LTLSSSHEATIESVRVRFCLAEFSDDPDRITATLGIQPDLVLRVGDQRQLHGGVRVPIRHSHWEIRSRNDSKDVNVQIRSLIALLDPVVTKIDPAWNPFVDVIWKGNYLHAGSGPFYERDVIAGIARLGAEIFQDIYQVDSA